MAITHITSIGAAQGASGGTTSAINTTGANLIIISIASYAPVINPTVVDNKSNTYTALTATIQGSSLRHLLYYTVGSITVGTGHTITVSSGTGSIYNCIVAHAFSGVAGYHSQSNTGGTTSPLSAGSVTPSSNGALIFTALGNETAATNTIPVGFTSGLDIPYGSGVNFGTTTAYLIQPTAAAINPQWSWTGTHAAAVASVAVFTATAVVAVGTAQFFFAVG